MTLWSADRIYSEIPKQAAASPTGRDQPLLPKVMVEAASRALVASRKVVRAANIKPE
jgi:hypothetical protein